MAKKRFKNDSECYDYLAETIAHYVESGFPITSLTGEQGGGKPDRDHLDWLKEALNKLGFIGAAGKCK